MAVRGSAVAHASRLGTRLAASLAGEVVGFGRVGDRLAMALVSDAISQRHTPPGSPDGEHRRVPVHAVQTQIPGEGLNLLVLWAASDDAPLPANGGFVAELSDGPAIRIPGAFGDALTELEQFTNQCLDGLDPAIREAALARTLDFTSELADDPAWALQLRIVRDVLRVRLPAVEAVPSARCAIHVDVVWRVDECSCYIKGWLLDRDGRLDRLTLMTPEGRTVDVLDRAFRYPRSDVSNFFGLSAREKLGLIAYVELPEPCVRSHGWLVQAHATGGGGVEAEMPTVIDATRDLRAALLNDAQLERLPAEALKREHVLPALTRIETRLREEIEIDLVEQFGTPPANPDVTIIVPLYQRLEFLEHQLAQFVHDPEIRASDLIYVLDSPEASDWAQLLAEQLYRLYGVPFRMATLTANGGFSVANNLGASLATGRMLLLLNSDVLPDRPGWLARMVEFYDSKPEIGVVAPKLLYEDESIQHAGLYFDRPAGAHVWSNEHYFKGLQRTFGPANRTRLVPAVTGACMMIETELYRSLGGLCGNYVRGDYEDSDLCLRLSEQGREVWYLAEVELYHLEGQSYPSTERAAASLYNRWLHTHVWRPRLEESER